MKASSTQSSTSTFSIFPSHPHRPACAVLRRWPQQWPSHPPRPLALTDTNLTQRFMKRDENQPSPRERVFCIDLVSPLGTSPPVPGTRGFPWEVSDTSLRKSLQGCLLHPWPRPGLDQHREGCCEQQQMPLSEGPAPPQPQPPCRAPLPNNFKGSSKTQCRRSFSPAREAFKQPQTLINQGGRTRASVAPKAQLYLCFAIRSFSEI